jgi:hypothetical protein
VKPEFNPEHSFDENFLGLEKTRATHARAPWCKGNKSQNKEPCSVCVGICVEMVTHNETKLENIEN